MEAIGSGECNVSSLEEMYTDFDGWTRRFTQMYRKRSLHFREEIKVITGKAECIDNRLIMFNIYNLLLNEWKKPQNEIYSNHYLYYSVLRFVNDNGKRVYIMISWGEPDRLPVLMFHGYMDTAAAFTMLLDHLPDNYYWVAFDLPGHGKSESFPPGPLISLIDFIEVVRVVVDSLKWDSFVAMAHSAGISIALLYNNIYPGKVKKVIAIDPAPAIAENYGAIHFQYYITEKYRKYYDTFGKFDKPNIFTYDEIVTRVAQLRQISEEQAEVLLSRSLVPLGNGKFKLSWDNRARHLLRVPASEDIFYAISSAPIPTLLFAASEDDTPEPLKTLAHDMIVRCSVDVPNYTIVTVPGNHQIHVTNPVAMAPHIVKFLDKKYEEKCKL